MLTNIKKHKDVYLSIWAVAVINVFSSYYVVIYFIPIPFIVYLIGSLVVSTLIIYIYYYRTWNNSAKDLFKTIIENDDKGLYIRLVNEFGLDTGEYIYYNNKCKYLKYRHSRKRTNLRYLLKEFRLKAR